MRSTFTELIYEAQSEETQRLRQIKNKAHNALKNAQKRGKDPKVIAQLEKDLADAWAAYNASKEADKAGRTASTPTPTIAPEEEPKGNFDKVIKQVAKNTQSKIGKLQSNQVDTNSDDYKKGYEDALEAIKKAIENKKNDQSQSGGQGSASDGLGIPDLDKMFDDIVDQGEQQGNQHGEEAGDSNGSGSGSNGSDGGSRDSKSDANQGIVRPEDCVDPTGSLSNCPGTAGGMISKSDGDKLAQAEGYPKEGGSEDAIDRDWADRAQQAAKKCRGKGAGYDKFAAKVDNLYKVTKDWKKELRNIVGHSISADDKRSAYANKNALAAQNRIARTDKDKYDNMDYMVAAIDTSGSMTTEFLQACLREVYQVALAKKPIKLVIMQFDTRITDIKEYHSVPELLKDIKNFKLKGGGGTEVKPLWDILRTDKKYKGRRAELVMIFTDGYLGQYKRDARTMQNLCWVIIDNLGFELQYKDPQTKCVRIKQSDIK